MDNLSVAPLVRAMPDCFPVQYKFLYYDEPCFLKGGTVLSGREPGQGWGWMDGQKRQKNSSSVLYHGKAMAKCIKASFRSPRLICVFVYVVCFFFLFVDGRPAVWTKRENQVCRRKKERGHSSALEDGEEEEGGMDRREVQGGDDTFGDSSCPKHERAFVLGGTERSGCWMFFMYLQGMYEYLINESQAQGKCSRRVALQSQPISHTHTDTHKQTHTQTHKPCPAV